MFNHGPNLLLKLKLRALKSNNDRSHPYRLLDIENPNFSSNSEVKREKSKCQFKQTCKGQSGSRLFADVTHKSHIFQSNSSSGRKKS
jgi:hypothetical protein